MPHPLPRQIPRPQPRKTVQRPATISAAPSVVVPTAPTPAVLPEREPDLPDPIDEPTQPDPIGNSTQPAPLVFTEASAVEYAVLHGTASYRSRAALDISCGENDEMRSRLFPTIEIQPEAGRAAPISSNCQDDPASAGIGIFLREPLFDGKAGWFRYLSAKHRTETARYLREATQNRVAADVRLGFARMRHWYRLSKAQIEELHAVQSLVERLSLLTAYGLGKSESLAYLTAQGENLRAGLKNC